MGRFSSQRDLSRLFLGVAPQAVGFYPTNRDKAGKYSVMKTTVRSTRVVLRQGGVFAISKSYRLTEGELRGLPILGSAPLIQLLAGGAFRTDPIAFAGIVP